MCLVLNPDPQMSLPIHHKRKTLNLTFNKQTNYFLQINFFLNV